LNSLDVDITGLEMLILTAGGFCFGTEVDNIISVVTSSMEIKQIDKSIPLIDLPMQLGTTRSASDDAKKAPCDALSANRHKGSVALLIDTLKGIAGVWVESVNGVVNIPLEKIGPLPTFLRSRMRTDCIWGIGIIESVLEKQEQELVILLDLGRYVLQYL
jgi:chemotaxis signal transduction protein